MKKYGKFYEVIRSGEKHTSRLTCLMITHRLPYPPDKGDRVRSFHILKALSQRFDIHLVTLVDQYSNPEHLEYLSRYCSKIYAADIRDRSRLYLATRSFILHEPVTYSASHSSLLGRKVCNLTRKHSYDLLYMMSSGMIPYLSKVQKPARATVMDFVDVGSAKWRNFDTLGSFYERFMHRREAKILSSEEIKTAALTDLNLFVTDKETQLFNNLARQSGRNFRDFSTCTLENGVDYSYWSQGHSLPSPYTLPKSPVIIFTGAMDYKPNIQGVLNFVEKVFPQILQEVPSAQFVIAGSSPTPEILKLVEKKTPHITVTGYISDMRPWLAHACVSVAPLKVACGVQNKILEAMAAGTAVVSSPKAAQGLSFPGTSPFFVAGTSRAFAHAVSVLLKNKNIRDEIALQASRKVIRFYSWEKRQRQLISMIDHIL